MFFILTSFVYHKLFLDMESVDGTRHVLSSSPEYHRTTGVLLYEPGEGLSGETEEEGDIGA